jgi:hypothetical protein
MEACLAIANAETRIEKRIPLLSAAALFAQVAEHLKRGTPLTEPIITHCRDAISRLGDDDTRSRIKGLLGDMIG